ncbi:MAG: glucan ABC transporter ATP-binding protein/ permease [Hyphomicrobiaceae bacterium]
MSLLRVYLRALGLLAAEKWLCAALVASGSTIALVQVYEQVLFGRVVDALARSQDAMPIILQWAALGLFGILAGVVVAVAADRLAHRNRLEAMRRGFERSITLPISYHARVGTGAMVRTILEGASTLFGLWLSFLREQTTALVGVLFLVPTAIAMNWRLAVLLAILAAVYAVLNALVVYRTSGGQDAVETYHIKVAGQVGDVIGNVTVVQSYARLAAEAKALKGLMGELLAAQYPVLNWWGLATVLARAASTITMVAVFAVGATLAAEGKATVGEIVSFIGFSQLLIGKLDHLSAFVTQVFMQGPTLRSYFALIDARADILDKPNAKALNVSSGDIRFEEVTFRYGPGEQGIFDVSFHVPAGNTVALVGPTGAGKTTTLALLQRLRDPGSGRILVDGADIRDVTLDSLRASIAVVFQDAGLFNRSIRENILVGRAGATDEEIEKAARLAEAHEFISQKSGGYGFVVGERGMSLSGGERQRVAIARAILKNASILILDEATSALDTETEGKIKRALDAVRKGRTTLIIAHRLSTVANADEILVFDKGRIVERGTFTDLVSKGGLFSRLVAEGDFTKPTDPEDNEDREDVAEA